MPDSRGSGIQLYYTVGIILDSGFRRNDGKWYFSTFYDAVNSLIMLIPNFPHASFTESRNSLPAGGVEKCVN